MHVRCTSRTVPIFAGHSSEHISAENAWKDSSHYLSPPVGKSLVLEHLCHYGCRVGISTRFDEPEEETSVVFDFGENLRTGDSRFREMT